MAEAGLRTWLKEMAKGTKEQKEPVLIGTEYVDTKRLIQQYEEEIKYHQLKLEKAEADLAACRAINGHGLWMALAHRLGAWHHRRHTGHLLEASNGPGLSL